MKNIKQTPNVQRYLKLYKAQELATSEENFEEAWEIEGAIERLTDKLTEEEKQLLYKIQMGV